MLPFFFLSLTLASYHQRYTNFVPIMSGSEITSSSAPVGDLRDGKGTEFIKVQNEDELRLAQMGRFSILCC